MKRLLRYFFEGLLVIVPAVLSIYIVYTIFVKIDGILGLPIPGAGFVITLVIITFVGVLASTFITEKLIGLVEKLFSRLPIVKIFYSSIKDLIGAFVGDKKSFDRPVLVTLDPNAGSKALGFITRDSLEFLGLREHVAVYIPQSYNFAGNLFIFPKEKVMPLDADGGDVMTFLVSGGVSGGESNNRD